MALTTSREQIFNTPLESGLRSLCVLSAVRPAQCDLTRIVIYDYLLVHSSDVDDGPTSLHPPSPLRSGELLVRRSLIKRGLELMIRKSLVTVTLTEEGIQYCASDLAAPFLGYLQSEYASRVQHIAKWIAEQFQPMSNDELSTFVTQNLGRWGAEFIDDIQLEEEGD